MLNSTWSFLRVAIALLVASGWTVSVCVGSTWLSEPYRVHIWYGGAPRADTIALCGSATQRGVERQIAAILGRAWVIRSQQVSTVTPFLRDDATFADAFAFQSEMVDADKLFVVSVTESQGAYAVQIRELDSQVQQWGPTLSFTLSQPQQATNRIANGILRAFRPIAKIGRVRQGQAAIEPRAGMLAVDVFSPLLPQPGHALAAVLTKLGSQVDGVSKEVQPVPWTTLVVEETARDRVDCQLVSGLRAPLRTRTARDVQRFAVTLLPIASSTTLRLVSREDGRPLAGYDVFQRPYGTKATQLVGRSDYQGRLVLPRTDDVVNTYYVRHGSALLAKLPLVVGAQPEVTVDLPDDSLRLAVEGYLKGIEDRLLDAVITRETKIIRARQALLDVGGTGADFAMIERLIQEARQLDQRRELNRLLQSRQTEFRSSNRRMQEKIDRMFTQTRQAIQKGFDPKPIDELEKQLALVRGRAPGGTSIGPAPTSTTDGEG